MVIAVIVKFDCDCEINTMDYKKIDHKVEEPDSLWVTSETIK